LLARMRKTVAKTVTALKRYLERCQRRLGFSFPLQFREAGTVSDSGLRRPRSRRSASALEPAPGQIPEIKGLDEGGLEWPDLQRSPASGTGRRARECPQACQARGREKGRGDGALGVHSGCRRNWPSGSMRRRRHWECRWPRSCVGRSTSYRASSVPLPVLARARDDRPTGSRDHFSLTTRDRAPTISRIAPMRITAPMVPSMYRVQMNRSAPSVFRNSSP